MFTLQEFFNDLMYGELSNVKIGNSATGLIQTSDYPKILSAMNLGLNALHERFPLREKKFNLYQQEGIDTYYVRAEHFETDVTFIDSDIYLLADENEPFENDLLKITYAWNVTNDKLYPLNDPAYKDTGMFTTSFDVINMTPLSPPVVIELTCRVSYPKIIPTSNFDPSTFEIQLPSFIKKPLLYFTASRLASQRGSDEQQSPASVLRGQYERACKDIVDYGLLNESSDTYSKFYTNGWA